MRSGLRAGNEKNLDSGKACFVKLGNEGAQIQSLKVVVEKNRKSSLNDTHCLSAASFSQYFRQIQK